MLDITKNEVEPSCGEPEFEFLDTMINELDSKIHYFQSRKIEFLRKMNSIRATTATLPTDVLANIFEHACSNQNAFPLVLGCVSTHWRETARSCPCLWTSLLLTMHTGYDKIPRRCIEVLKIYFANVKNLTVSLKLVDHCSKPDIDVTLLGGPWAPFQEIFDVIFVENPRKLEGFTCLGISGSWWPYVRRCIRPEVLVHLGLIALEFREAQAEIEIEIEVSVFPFPSLHTATIISHLGTRTLPLQLPWNQLTHVNFVSVRIDQCLHILFQCPLLVELHADNPILISVTRSELSFILQQQNIIAPNLIDLNWTFSNDPWTYFLMTSIQFPSLQKLSCKHPVPKTPSAFDLLMTLSHAHINIQNRMGYFIRKLPSLTIFVADARFIRGFTGENSISNEVDGIFCVGSLEELRLKNVDAEDLLAICDTLRFYKSDGWDAQILPNLRLITFEDHRLGCHLLEPNIFSAFVRMLRSRRDGKVERWEKCAQLECVRLGLLTSLEGLSEQSSSKFRILQRLVNEGLNLELATPRGDIISWP